MVGVVTTPRLRERLGDLINSAKVAIGIPSKLDILRQLKEDLPIEDPVLVSEFLPGLLDLQSDRFSPVRKAVTEIIGEIGLKHLDFLPEIVPVLVALLQDVTPAVARQAITCGIGLFHSTLKMIATQGLCSSELDTSLETSWAWMLNFKEKIYSIAFKAGNDGIRLLALKFVEALILLYTPDPDGSLDPPSCQSFEGSSRDFNISWLRGGHPTLNVGDMSVEATQKLGLLLDLLRFPTVKSLSNSMIVVLIKSLSAIANKRPAFYGRIVPVLLGLDLSSSTDKGIRFFGACHALKSAFQCCLKCTHPSAAPWRDRIIGALREMNAEAVLDTEVHHVVKTNGNTKEKELTDYREEKLSEEACDAVSSNLGRKRSGAQGPCDPAEDDVLGKRVKPMPTISEESTQDLNRGTAVSQHDGSNNGMSTSRDGGNGPVQQLVAMFGALVAQGEKAFGSLEILISSISADLLAEVVMANMYNLPSNCPKAEEGDEVPVEMSIVGIDVKYLPSYFADAFPRSSGLRQLPSVTDTQHSVSTDLKDHLEEEFNPAATTDSAAVCFAVNHEMTDEMCPANLAVHDEAVSSGVEKYPLAVQSDTDDIGNFESQIPGLDTFVHADESVPGIQVSASVAPANIEDVSQEQVSSLGRTSASDVVQSVSTDRSEELSPKGVVADVNSLVSSTATSVVVSHHSVLPKMLAPVVELDDEQKDHLQKVAFTRIVEAYRQIMVAGAAQVRSSLLVFLSSEFPLELDPWKVMQQHILSDYMSHDGHELTLRVLYRLHGDAEVESDFFSSTTATSVYETFLLAVAEALRDSLPPSDKSLSRLLCEVPSLPQSVLKFLECLCSPGGCDKSEKDSHSGDRVTQGLSTVWNLILMRPSIRDVCLRIALKSTVHHLEEVRMKAIRLVANKLFPLASIAQQIEDFAKKMLLSVTNSNETERTETEGSNAANKGFVPEKTLNEQSSVSRDSSFESRQSCSPESTSLLVSEAQRCMSLYFALCTKKHSLIREIFVIYEITSNSVKQAVHDHIPMLVRTMGSSPELLEILSDPPDGSENLLMQVLHTLTDGTVPSPELIRTIRKLYDLRIKDIELLIPVLPFLPKDEVLMKFPNLVSLPADKFQVALTRMLQGPLQLNPVLTPVEVLIAIHGIDPEKDGIPLKKVTDACNICFEQRQIFTQQVLAKVLNQLVEQIPPPLLFMRTVLQAIGAFPALVDFIMEILSRLVSKQIWRYPKLWVGFLKCAQLTKPQSYDVLLKLPPAQLESALTKIPALKAPLAAHASQENFRSSLPRATLVVLGIASDTQVSTQAQSSHTLAQDTTTSEEVAAEKSKESSSAS